MTSSGRTIGENLSSLADSLKRPRDESKLSMSLSERSRVIASTVPLVLPASGIKRQPNAKAIAATIKDSTEDTDPKEETEATEETPTEKDKVTSETIQKLQKKREKLRDDIERMKKKRRTIFRKQQELWGIYQYGLKKISELNELHDAPDALLPGNY